MESDEQEDNSTVDGDHAITGSEDNQSASSFKIPDFKITSWSPEPPAGLHYMCLLPVAVPVQYSQNEHVGKLKTSTAHRKQRLKAFTTGRTTCRNILDESRLRKAASQNDCITVIELLEGGADPSCEDEKKRTPLHFAASQGYETVTKVLLDKGADPNKKDFIGNTPLHLAACTCQVPIVTLLLKAGTDLKSVDQYGRTPLTLAKSRLKWLAEDKAYSNDKIKDEILQVSDMMKTYLEITGDRDDACQLDDLCQQLQRTSTREQVDHVNNLLSDFASLSIQKKEQPG